MYSIRRPAYNWDMLGYMALTLKIENTNTVFVHDKVYAEAEKEAVWPYQHILVDSNVFRKRMKEDPDAFNRQLAFYVVKPMYVRMVYFFYKAGFPLARATLMPSIFSFALICLLIYFWLKKYLHITGAFCLSSFIILSRPMLEIAKLSTPDALSALLLLLSFYFIVEKPKKWIMIFMLTASIFARLDNIITCVAILTVATFSSVSHLKISLREFLLAIIIMISCYFMISSNVKIYGWDISFYKSFAHYLTSTTYEPQSSVSIKSYLHLIYLGIIRGLYSTDIIFLFIMLSLLFFYSNGVRLQKFSFDQSIAITLVLIFMIRLILFPEIMDRAYTAFYIMAIILLARKLFSNNVISKPE